MNPPEGEATDQGSESDLPWRPGRVRKGPAFIIVGVVAVISIGGFLLAALGGKPEKTTPPSGGVVKGTGLSPSSATAVFAPIRTGGEPPTDIMNSLVVPAGAHALSHEFGNAGLELYDGTVTLSVPATAAHVLSFYTTELKATGWKLSGESATADGKGTEIFGTHSSSDGFYWEVGVEVTDASPSITPALNGDATAGESTLSLTVFERDDED